MAKAKPDFKSPISDFITVEPEHIEHEPIKETVAEVKPEVKSRRVQILTKPSTHKALTKLAKKGKTSVNDIINTALEEYIESHR